eukprot:Nk52_evm8s859 gene=Nk52_evmTU8s859
MSCVCKNSVAVLLLLGVMLHVAFAVSKSRDEHRVTDLPRLDSKASSVKQWAGYLNVNKSHDRNLFYWYIEAYESPEDKPLVLWLNGGPGCSSLYGLLYEHGHIQFVGKTKGEDMKLTRNEYGWAKEANMLYLEGPASVGYAYSKEEKDYVTNDTRTAADNYRALQEFFEIFPELRQKEFFITGESYAGVYVPTLADEIHRSNLLGEEAHINLKGYIVGNGCTDPEIDTNAVVPFVYGHSLISQSHFEALERECKSSYINPKGKCKKELDNMGKMTSSLCVYNVLWQNFQEKGTPDQFAPKELDGNGVESKPSAAPMPQFAPVHNFLLSLDGGFTPPCIDTEQGVYYLNLPEVRKSLHVKDESEIGEWGMCSSKLKYTKDLYAKSMMPIHKRLVEHYRILIVSGDQDLSVPHTGSEYFVRHMGLKMTRDWRPWWYKDQIAGYTVEYGNMSYASVKGAGHMIPYYIPTVGLEYFRRFIRGESL